MFTQEVESEEIEKWKARTSEEKEQCEITEPPQLVVQQFSMEALHHTMLNNNSQVLAMHDEMSVMYSQLDAYIQTLDLNDQLLWTFTMEDHGRETSRTGSKPR